MTAHRLPNGGLIDRTVTVPFRFDGRDYTGHAGDTLASALLANGVTLFGRSFKYHRPRGLLSACTRGCRPRVRTGFNRCDSICWR
jgi:sarcosine oxidase subunit alpha